MAINSIGENLATNGTYAETVTTKDKSVLGKDDFMKLLLVELQYQDPTEPMDSEKILTQTSQLASLESAENTNKALDDLAASLSNAQQFSTVSAIGKRADLGSDAIKHDEGTPSSFEIYFSEDITNGTVDITDLEGNAIASIPIEMPEDEDGNVAEKMEAGVYQFDWDGKDSNGNSVDSGIYRVNSVYYSSNGEKNTSRLGAYPIESIRFEEGEAYVKLGSSYVPLADVVEVY
ncbi:MAG: flagellar hook capping protein [Thiovulaceae bacterium]|nr:flagellar hook capping protein [Sulfurimonadaceae bacterium]